jgi:hypothetical protein
MILTKEDHKKIFNTDIYSGDQIHERFAYKILREKMSPTGNIFAFRAPMDVTINLIDLEDKLNNDYIHSEDAVNFIWEIPNLCPVGAVAFQRLFCTQVANILSQLIKKPIEVDGDDFMVHDSNGFTQRGIVQTKGKASVSITYSKDNVALGHLAVNIKAGNKAPHFAYSTNLTDEQVDIFMRESCSIFNNMTEDMWVAASKITI